MNEESPPQEVPKIADLEQQVAALKKQMEDSAVLINDLKRQIAIRNEINVRKDIQIYGIK